MKNMEIKESILDTIGETPLVKIRALNPHPTVNIYAKLEGFNPMGSVKERIALYMVEGAERDGILRRGMTIVESSSGNTGIGLAMVGAVKGYKVLITMPRAVSIERRKMIRAFGAKLVLVDGGSDAAWDKADEIARSNPDKYCRLSQYIVPYNVEAHYKTTGPEIWRQTGGRMDYFVVGLGTTGTIMGAARFLKERNPGLKVVAVEPQPGHKQQGLRNMTTQRVPPIYDTSIVDETIIVYDDDAFRMTRLLARKEGIFAGISSGTAMFAALELARRVQNKDIVVIFPDRGDKYLSIRLF